VRIMTIHSAKGLEFPIVAVAECFGVKADNAMDLVLKDCERAYFSLKPGVSAIETIVIDTNYRYKAPGNLDKERVSSLAEYRGALLQSIADGELAERKRLLYVALTRASEALIVSMHAGAGSDGPKLEPLQESIAAALFPGGVFPEEDRPVPYGGSEPLSYHYHELDEEESQPEVLPEDEPSERFILEVLPESKLELSIPKWRTGLVSYSSLASKSVVRPSETETGELQRKSGDARVADSDKATDFGSAFHRIAQLSFLLTPEQALERLELTAKGFGVEEVTRLRTALENWFSSNVYAQVLGFEACSPEVPFCIPLGDVFLEGEIDLLCTNKQDDFAFVIDYKTGGNPAETQEELHEKHLLQAQCYAYALLNSGFSKADFAFVRVEQYDESGDIQSVMYSFNSNDLLELKTYITESSN